MSIFSTHGWFGIRLDLHLSTIHRKLLFAKLSPSHLLSIYFYCFYSSLALSVKLEASRRKCAKKIVVTERPRLSTFNGGLALSPDSNYRRWSSHTLSKNQMSKVSQIWRYHLPVVKSYFFPCAQRFVSCESKQLQCQIISPLGHILAKCQRLVGTFRLELQCQKEHLSSPCNVRSSESQKTSPLCNLRFLQQLCTCIHFTESYIDHMINRSSQMYFCC